MILQLNPPLPVVTPKGKALAHFMIDMGPEHNINWVCFQDSNGECWTWQNPQVRAQINITQGREHVSPFYDPDSVVLNKEENEEDNYDDDESCICDRCKGYVEENTIKEILDIEQEHNEMYSEMNKVLSRVNKTNVTQYKKIIELESLIKKLISKDHIYKTSLDEVVTKLADTEEEKLLLYGLVGKGEFYAENL